MAVWELFQQLRGDGRCHTDVGDGFRPDSGRRLSTFCPRRTIGVKRDGMYRRPLRRKLTRPHCHGAAATGLLVTREGLSDGDSGVAGAHWGGEMNGGWHRTRN